MELQIIDGYITGYAIIGGIENSVTVNNDFLDNLNSEYVSIGAYKYSDGIVVLDNEKLSNILVDKKNNEIRFRRVNECFIYTDRFLWFQSLTDTQKSEIKIWREAWLNATETKAIPEKPAWLT